jgi:hypothetical protein
VNGVERAKLRIAKSVFVGLAGGTSWQIADFRQRHDQTVTAKYAHATEFRARDVRAALVKGLQAPEARTRAIRSLGYSAAEAEQYFPIATDARSFELAVESTTGGRLILGDDSRFVLFGQDQALVPGPINQQVRDVTFVMLLGTEKSSIGGQSFVSGAEEVMGLKRVLRLRADGVGVSDSPAIVFQDTGLGDSRIEKAGGLVADGCVIERTEDELAFLRSGVPAYQTVFSPCFIYDEGVSERSHSNGLMLRVLNLVFAQAGRDTSGSFKFGDWSSGFIVRSI